ncbi:hypothetical protein F5146DRAFT_221083 [Armillaria mellea]|nr:hypothetical protein F5146DRAFT_221083 [Armillaria mellea]
MRVWHLPVMANCPFCIDTTDHPTRPPQSRRIRYPRDVSTIVTCPPAAVSLIPLRRGGFAPVFPAYALSCYTVRQIEVYLRIRALRCLFLDTCTTLTLLSAASQHRRMAILMDVKLLWNESWLYRRWRRRMKRRQLILFGDHLDSGRRLTRLGPGARTRLNQSFRPRLARAANTSSAFEDVRHLLHSTICSCLRPLRKAIPLNEQSFREEQYIRQRRLVLYTESTKRE